MTTLTFLADHLYLDRRYRPTLVVSPDQRNLLNTALRKELKARQYPPNERLLALGLLHYLSDNRKEDPFPDERCPMARILQANMKNAIGTQTTWTRDLKPVFLIR